MKEINNVNDSVVQKVRNSLYLINISDDNYEGYSSCYHAVLDADNACFIPFCESAIIGTTGLGGVLVYDYTKLIKAVTKYLKNHTEIVINNKEEVIESLWLFLTYDVPSLDVTDPFVVVYPTPSDL